MRYINQIGVEGVNPTEWNNYISDYLTLPAAQWAGDEKDSIVNTVGQVIFDYKDSMMNFNYGINAQAASTYVLDFDCYGGIFPDRLFVLI